MAKNQFTTTSTLDRTAAVDLLQKKFDVAWLTMNDAEDIKLKQYFSQEDADSLNWQITYVTSHLPLPEINEDTAALPYFVAAPGYDKNITLVNRRSGVRVTDTMLTADRFGQVMGMVSGLPSSAQRLDEYQRAAIFDNGHSGTAGSDSLSLFNDSHPLENPERGTYDNKGTGALSGPNLQALRLLARKMVDPQGDPMPVNAKDLLVPEDLEQKANELTGFGGVRSKPEGALNDPNVFLPSFNVVVSTYLSSAVQYALIGMASQKQAMGLHEVTMTDWNVKDNAPANADLILDKRIKSVKKIDFTRTRYAFGSTGA